MQSPPLNTGCASVTIKPIPSTGGEVVVFNDINLFDAGASSTNNNQFYRNLVQFTAPGARASQTGVMMHRGHSSRCGYAGGPCVSGALAGFYSVLTGAGFNITDIDNSSAAITSIPASIKVLFLWNPVTSYASAEINVMKQFASEGGRIIFIGEWDGYYGTAGIATENAFFASMGAQMTNQGGAYDCGRVDLPASSLRPHQITAGMNGLRIGCASRVLPGPNDYPLFYNTGNTIVLGAVAKVDLTPLSSASFLASAQGIRVPKTPSKVEASAGMEYVSWSDVPVPKP